MSELFDTAVLHVSRLISVADAAGVPREHLAYLVTPTEHDKLRTEMVGCQMFRAGSAQYDATHIRIRGVLVVYE